MSGSGNAGDAGPLERVMLAARLKGGTRGRAEQLVTDEARADAPEEQFARGAIFLSDSEVVFLFEGAGAPDAVRGILDDPVRSTVLGSWLPLFEGPLHRVYEAHSWRRA